MAERDVWKRLGCGNRGVWHGANSDAVARFVVVYAERHRMDAEIVKVTEASVTYVATDEARQSRPLPPL